MAPVALLAAARAAAAAQADSPVAGPAGHRERRLAEADPEAFPVRKA